MKRLILFALCITPLWPAACTLTNTAGSACSTKTCSLTAIAADSTHTVWTGSGCTANAFIPGNGNTVVIPDTYTLTVNQNWTIGASGANNTAAAIQTNATGLVEVASGATLRARGDVLSNNTVAGATNFLVLDAGSTFIFDASQASSPTTTRYRIGDAPAQSFRSFSANGTSGSHVTVTSDLTNGALPGQFRFANVGAAQIYYGGNIFNAVYTDFSHIGDASAFGEAFLWGGYGCGGGCTYSAYVYRMQHDTFNYVGPNRNATTISGNASVLIDHNVFTNSLGSTNLYLQTEVPAAGITYTVSNNVFDKRYSDNGSGCGALSEPGFAFSNNFCGDSDCT